MFLRFVCSLPFGIPAFGQHLQFALFAQAVHGQADGIPAHAGAKPLHIRDPKGAGHALKRLFHQIGFLPPLRALPLGALLEFTVGPSPGRKKKCEPAHEGEGTFPA